MVGPLFWWKWCPFKHQHSFTQEVTVLLLILQKMCHKFSRSKRTCWWVFDSRRWYRQRNHEAGTTWKASTEKIFVHFWCLGGLIGYSSSILELWLRLLATVKVKMLRLKIQAGLVCRCSNHQRKIELRLLLIKSWAGCVSQPRPLLKTKMENGIILTLNLR